MTPDNPPSAPSLRACVRWIVDRDGECLADHPDILAKFKAALAANPMEMQVDADWLRRKVETDPDDAEVEARSASRPSPTVERREEISGGEENCPHLWLTHTDTFKSWEQCDHCGAKRPPPPPRPACQHTRCQGEGNGVVMKWRCWDCGHAWEGSAVWDGQGRFLSPGTVAFARAQPATGAVEGEIK